MIEFFPYVLYILLLGSAVRLIIGPSLFDRLMALSMVSALVVTLMCAYAVLYQRSFYLDIAMVYALLSFAEILAITRFHARRRRTAEAPPEESIES